MSSFEDRLRASKERADAADVAVGHDAGKSWARNLAEAPELQRLERLHDELDAQSRYDWDWYFEEEDREDIAPVRRATEQARQLEIAMDLFRRFPNDRVHREDQWWTLTGKSADVLYRHGRQLKEEGLA
jgi:hypothetical protein